MELIVLGWFVFSFIPAVMAERRGRSGFLWFIISFFISPLFAGLLVAVLPNLKQEKEDALRSPCPMCAERIPRAAHLCPQCRTELPDRWDRAPRDVIRRYIQRKADASPPAERPTGSPNSTVSPSGAPPI